MDYNYDFIKDNIFCDYDLVILNEIDSTNEYAKKCYLDSVIISKKQTAGKGTYNREFNSPCDSGVYMSIVFHNLNNFDYGLLSMKVGVAITTFLNEIYNLDLKIKWINDIYKDDSKVVGILCESVFNESVLDKIVVGIGINLYYNDVLSKSLGNKYGYLFEDRIDINILVTNLINNIFSTIFNDVNILNKYKELSYLYKKKVEIEEEGQKKTGYVSNFFHDGGICIEFEKFSKIYRNANLKIKKIL